MNDKIYGFNPVIEALSSDREIDKILIKDGIKHSKVSKITALAKEKKIPFQFVNQAKLESLCEGGNHQGVVAFSAMHSYSTIEEILEYAREKKEPPFVVILDSLTDPHNLGSIIRTANVAGAHGVIIPKNRSVGLTSTVFKVSAGASEYTKVAKVTNLSRTVDDLKKEGLWVVGTDLSAKEMHYECDLKGALAVIIGSEGEGMSRILKEKCDFLVKIPMLGKIESLNASVAAGVLIYEAVRQRSI